MLLYSICLCAMSYAKNYTRSLRPGVWKANCGGREMPGPFLRSGLLRQGLSCLYLSFLWGSWDGARHKPFFLSRAPEEVASGRSPSSNPRSCTLQSWMVSGRFHNPCLQLGAGVVWGQADVLWCLVGPFLSPLNTPAAQGPQCQHRLGPVGQGRGRDAGTAHMMSSSVPDFQMPDVSLLIGKKGSG